MSSLELINVKGKTFSKDYDASDEWNKFIINKNDILLIEEDNPCKDLCMLHLRSGLILIVPKWDNSHFWRTVHSASLDREYVEKKIKEMKKTLRTAKDEFIFAYDYDNSISKFECVEDWYEYHSDNNYKLLRNLIKKENPEWTEAQIEAVCREKEVKFKQDYKDFNTITDACWDSIQESEKHLNNAPATLNDVCKSLKDVVNEIHSLKREIEYQQGDY